MRSCWVGRVKQTAHRQRTAGRSLSFNLLCLTCVVPSLYRCMCRAMITRTHTSGESVCQIAPHCPCLCRLHKHKKQWQHRQRPCNVARRHVASTIVPCDEATSHVMTRLQRAPQEPWRYSLKAQQTGNIPEYGQNGVTTVHILTQERSLAGQVPRVRPVCDSGSLRASSCPLFLVDVSQRRSACKCWQAVAI